MSDLNHIATVAARAADAASEVLMQYFGNATVQTKGLPQDLVTQADLEAERTIVGVIREAFTDHSFLLEEGGLEGSVQSEHLWVVDPLDGTTNYAHGIPQFSTAIGYVSRGELQVGVVHDPCRHERFAAILGHGATLNGESIQVSRRSSLSESIIATGFYYDRGQLMRKTLDSIEALFGQNIHGIRRFGGAALDQCWIAAGRFEGFFEYQLSPWDYAAAALIVTEAGGHVSDRQGRDLTLQSGSLIASNAAIHDDLLSAVRWND